MKKKNEVMPSVACLMNKYVTRWTNPHYKHLTFPNDHECMCERMKRT